jgi:hypothetical protein
VLPRKPEINDETIAYDRSGVGVAHLNGTVQYESRATDIEVTAK